jgi:hypothetical protein
MIQTTIYAVLMKPNGELLKRESNLAGSEHLFKSVHPVVAVFTKKWDDADPAYGPFWDEYSGNSMYSVVEGDDEVVISAHDVNPAKTRKKGIGKADSAQTQWEQVDSKLADAVMGGGASWPVVDDGQGSFYEEKLQDARVLVGYPLA